MGALAWVQDPDPIWRHLDRAGYPLGTAGSSSVRESSGTRVLICESACGMQQPRHEPQVAAHRDGVRLRPWRPDARTMDRRA